MTVAATGMPKIVAVHSVLGSYDWIPAFAGMTVAAAGMTGIVAVHSVLGSPTWIPAFAGMTEREIKPEENQTLDFRR